jgi:hypothetical protein
MRATYEGIFIILAIWALSGTSNCAGQDKVAMSESLLDAEAKLADLKSQLAEKEKVLHLLKGASCRDADEKCRAQKEILGHKLRRRQVSVHVYPLAGRCIHTP